MKAENSILKKRVYAFTTDLSIIVVANYFFMASFNHFVQTVFFHFPIRVQLLLINKMATISSVSLMSLTFAYFSLFYFLSNGQTMGKALFGLQVKNHNGEELTLEQSMIRSASYFACAMTGSFLFALSFIRKDEKSLADIFSKTIVENENIKPNTKGTEFQLTLLKTQKESIESNDSTPVSDDQAA